MTSKDIYKLMNAIESLREMVEERILKDEADDRLSEETGEPIPMDISTVLFYSEIDWALDHLNSAMSIYSLSSNDQDISMN